MDFIKLNIVIVCLSDTRDLESDISGKTLVQMISDFGHNIVDRIVIKDDFKIITDKFLEFSNRKDIDINPVMTC